MARWELVIPIDRFFRSTTFAFIKNSSISARLNLGEEVAFVSGAFCSKAVRVKLQAIAKQSSAALNRFIPNQDE